MGTYTEEQLNQWQTQSEAESMWAAQRASSVDMLSQLGFKLDMIVSALNDSSDDVNAAMDALLATNEFTEEGKNANYEIVNPVSEGATVTESTNRPKGRWRHKRHSGDQATSNVRTPDSAC